MAQECSGVTDAEVTQRARTEHRILITNDKDFGELVYLRGDAPAGVLLMRFTVEDGERKRERLQRLWPLVESRVASHFVVVSEKGIRIRPIPAARQV